MKYFLILFFFSVVCYAQESIILGIVKSSGDTSGTPQIQVDTEALAFGSMDSSSSVDSVLPVIVTNTGTANLILDSLTGLAAPFTEDGSYPDTITAGSSDTINFTFDRNHASDSTFTDTATVYSNANNVEITMSATITIPVPPDTIPDAFSFTDQSDVALNTSTISDTVVLAGFDSAAISISGNSAEYRVDGGSWTTAQGTAYDGDSISLRMTSSADSQTTVSTVLTVGGVTDTWYITTPTVTGTHCYTMNTSRTGDYYIGRANVYTSTTGDYIVDDIDSVEYYMENVLSAGDTLLIRGGTYYIKNRIQVSATDGTAENPIVVKGYGDEQVIIDYDSALVENPFSIGGSGANHSDYWRVENIEFHNAPPYPDVSPKRRPVVVRGSYFQLRGCTFYDCDVSPMNIWGGDHALMEGNYFHQDTPYDGNGINLYSYPDYNLSCDSVIIQFNYFSGYGHSAINIFPETGTTDSVGVDNFYLDGLVIRYNLFDSTVAPTIGNSVGSRYTRNMQIYGNVFINSHIAIKTDAQGGYPGAPGEGYDSDLKIYNNTFVFGADLNGASGSGAIYLYAGIDNVIKNNIFTYKDDQWNSNKEIYIKNPSGRIIENNSFYNKNGSSDDVILLTSTGYTVAEANAESWGADNIWLEPAFVDSGSNWSLQDTSSLIGAGQTLDSEFGYFMLETDFPHSTHDTMARQGSWDIGAYDYYSGSYTTGGIDSIEYYIESILSAGDTLLIRGGTYNQTSQIQPLGVSGTANDPIVVKAYGDETPIIDQAGISANGGLRLGSSTQQCHYWRIEGITFQNSAHDYNPVIMRGDYIQVRGCTFTNSGWTALSWYGGDHALIEGNYINGVYQDGWGSSDGGNGINLFSYPEIGFSCDSAIIQFNYIKGAAGHAGLNFFPESSGDIVDSCNTDAFYIDGVIVRYNYVDSCKGTLFARWTRNMEIYGNIFVYHHTGIHLTNGTSAQYPCRDDCGANGGLYYNGANNQIYNNIFIAGQDLGYTGMGACHIYSGKTHYIKNNIFAYLDDQWNSTREIYVQYPDTLEIENNSFVNATGSNSDIAKLSSTNYTLAELNSSAYAANNIWNNPAFIDSNVNWSLQDSSSLIDAGDTLGGAFNQALDDTTFPITSSTCSVTRDGKGNSWDIGAYEKGDDIEPDAFSFTDVTGASVSTVTTSDSVILAGFDSAAINLDANSISNYSALYKINSGSFTSSEGTAVSGDTIYLRMTSSADSQVTVDATLTVGLTSTTWRVTTVDSTAGDWKPTDLVNLMLWLTADSTSSVTVDGNGRVSDWDDLGPFDFDATQATADNRPYFDSSGYLLFNDDLDSAHYLTLGTQLGKPGNYTITIVGSFDKDTLQETMFGQFGGDFDRHDQSMFIGISNTNERQLGMFNSNSDDSAGVAYSGFSVDISEKAVYTVKYTDGDSTHEAWLNDTEYTSVPRSYNNDGYTHNDGTAYETCIGRAGAYYDTSPPITNDWNLDGKIYEIIVDSGRTSNEHDDLMDYIKTTHPGIFKPSIPDIASPADGDIEVSLTPTLEWTMVDTIGTTYFHLQLDNNSDFSSTIDDDTTSSYSFATSALDSFTTYYWRVKSVNEYDSSDYCATVSFTTYDSIAPAEPVLTYPQDGQNGIPLSFTLTWGSVVSATSYRFQLDSNSSFSSALYDSSLAGTSCAISGLDSSDTYYVRLKSFNSWDSSAWSKTYSFNTVTPTPPAEDYPFSPVAIDTVVIADELLAYIYDVQAINNTSVLMTAIAEIDRDYTYQDSIAMDLQTIYSTNSDMSSPDTTDWVWDLPQLHYNGSMRDSVSTGQHIMGLTANTTYYWMTYLTSVVDTGVGGYNTLTALSDTFSFATTNVAVGGTNTGFDTAYTHNSSGTTYYVDLTGTGDTLVISDLNSFFSTDPTASNGLKPGDSVLFKRGTTFPVTNNNWYYIWGKQDSFIVFSTYGSGSKPIIQRTSSSKNIHTNGYSYVIFENIQFGVSGGGRGSFYNQAKKTTYDDYGEEYCKFEHLKLIDCDFVNSNFFTTASAYYNQTDYRAPVQKYRHGWSNIEFRRCTFNEYGLDEDAINLKKPLDSVWVNYCTFGDDSPYVQEALDIAGGYDHVVEYNKFYPNAGGTAIGKVHSQDSHVSNMLFRGNFLIVPDGAATSNVFGFQNISNSHIYHNTFISARSTNRSIQITQREEQSIYDDDRSDGEMMYGVFENNLFENNIIDGQPDIWGFSWTAFNGDTSTLATLNTFRDNLWANTLKGGISNYRIISNDGNNFDVTQDGRTESQNYENLSGFQTLWEEISGNGQTDDNYGEPTYTTWDVIPPITYTDFTPANGDTKARNQGRVISGWTKDLAGNAIVGTPDIGCLENQTP